MPLISPSILSADFANLGRDIQMINESQADWFHCDVMDGVFVPNISFGLPIIQAVKKIATKPLDVHLMMVEPDRYIKDFRAAGADILTVHFEACRHIDRTLHEIKENGMKAGISINPGTSVELLVDILPIVDLVLVMSVNPGFGGQQFITNAVNKVLRLVALRKTQNREFLIEVDGGVNDSTGGKLVDAGADCLVAGSYVFGSPDPAGQIKILKALK